MTRRFTTRLAIAVALLTCAALGSSVLSQQVATRAGQFFRFPGATVNDDAVQSGVWFTSGDHRGEDGPPTPGRDLAMMSYDKGAKKWTRARFGSPAGTNESHLVFGQKLYAPTDGEVITCWRNAPDNPKPGRSLPERDGCDGECDGCGGNCDIKPDCSCTIPRSGNHINIKLADGSVLLLAHLQSGSIPQSVCPKTGVYVKDANAKTIGGVYYDEIYFPPGNRPKVYRGQFIGRAGNSGASSGPHLHVHLKPCDNCDSIPLPFENARRQEISMGNPQQNTDPNKWVPLKAALLPQQQPGEKREVILADPPPPQK